MSYKPETDGIDHINIYSKGCTELGRFLSNFTHSPVETEDGHFESIEGYWYWLGTNRAEKDVLRRLIGYQAKVFGRKLRALDWQDSEDFKQKICNAITIKLHNNKDYLGMLQQSTLPLVHYYVMYNKIITPKEGQWIIDHINTFRNEIF
jgi:predicted NAD-dependent protein-ADP-ribosyltransferase YbiA (DUF1768 family)